VKPTKAKDVGLVRFKVEDILMVEEIVQGEKK